MSVDDSPLWAPANPEISATLRLIARVNTTFAQNLSSYHDLWKWSTTNIDDFWSIIWDETKVVGHKGSSVVDATALPSHNPVWFPDASLNWAENMLQCRSDDKVALIEATEPIEDGAALPDYRRCTYAELYTLVASAVSALLHYGLKPGDRVASYASNCIENVVACLATTALGGIWVSAAADFGAEGVLERLEQVKPKFLFAVNAVVYNGKIHQHLPKVSALLDGLSKKVDLAPKVVVIEPPFRPHSRDGWNGDWISWASFISSGEDHKLGRTADGEIEWRRQNFDWPLWILFSSGTTGRPKPIVHRAGGMLLQAKKEFSICADLNADDVFFYYTTTGWMMWNFLVSGLSLGCTLVLYDGSPLKDPGLLWRMVDDLGITIFGTSAKYLDQLSKKYRPAEVHNLKTVRHIYSTGSPLAPPLFDYVYKHISDRVLLGSITGGTDICSLFAGMCSALPVYRGEIQCRMLGMAVESYSPTGTLNPPDEPGELVCTKPFPCMPLGFWPLPGHGTEEAVKSAATRFFESYFSEFKDVWYHGDHIIITRSRAGNGGGLIMLGRSDGVLNPGGIRFGSAEIYDVLDLFTGPDSDPSLTDYLAVGQKIDNGMDERVILFVKLRDGQHFSSDFESKIKTTIRARRSPRHVPAKAGPCAIAPFHPSLTPLRPPFARLSRFWTFLTPSMENVWRF
ncbi:acetyl-CoA synthetase [Coprinopsis cinerea AmutBmut pab1-1]|nr:acetyl-CoA synthetase [Coprinopsis cinerea AmutBmut pab1-1]